jgi:hypothetical protein
VEYDTMVRDLLGDDTHPAQAFASESPMTRGVNFETNTYAGVSTLIAQQYEQAAETLAKNAVSDANNLNNVVLPCHTQDDACAQQFIATFAGRAFRGQLEQDTSSALFELYSTAKAQFDFTTGIQAIITAVLESPRFLYVIESGAAQSGSVVALTPSEVAARLALFLWRSVPDAALMQAAAAGQLSTPDEVEQQAVRMLADTRAKGALDDFTTQWMELQATATLGKDTQFDWNNHPKLGQEMKDETLTNFSQIVLAADGALTDLLASPSSYVNGELANFYGVPPGTGAGITVDDPALDDKNFLPTLLPNRAGILTNGSVLATQAHTSLPSTVLRGKLVREELLCDVIQPPPPGIPPAPTSVADGGTTRSEFEAHESIPYCAGCHKYMDPIGFGFGHFDATGAYQVDDANGHSGSFPPIDATGQVNAPNPGELDATFDGAVDLAAKLAAATQVKQCFALQELRYALSRVETLSDACSAQGVYGEFASSAWNVKRLLVAITRSDAFRYRAPSRAGSSCR